MHALGGSIKNFSKTKKHALEDPVKAQKHYIIHATTNYQHFTSKTGLPLQCKELVLTFASFFGDGAASGMLF